MRRDDQFLEIFNRIESNLENLVVFTLLGVMVKLLLEALLGVLRCKATPDKGQNSTRDCSYDANPSSYDDCPSSFQLWASVQLDNSSQLTIGT